MRQLDVKQSNSSLAMVHGRRMRILVPWAVACLFCWVAFGRDAQDAAVAGLIRGVEQRYNHARTLSIDFTESYSIAGHRRRPEQGTVVLRKPGRMRWTYSQPAGKLFVSDGKNVFLYTKTDNRVEKSALKASDDLRAPMAFLLGKLQLTKEFRNFRTLPDQNGTWLEGDAASERVPYSKVSMLVAPDHSIRQLTVTGRDESVLAFHFQGEVLNPPVNASLFEFNIPAGAEVIDAVSQPVEDH